MGYLRKVVSKFSCFLGRGKFVKPLKSNITPAGTSSIVQSLGDLHKYSIKKTKRIPFWPRSFISSQNSRNLASYGVFPGSPIVFLSERYECKTRIHDLIKKAVILK